MRASAVRQAVFRHLQKRHSLFAERFQPSLKQSLDANWRDTVDDVGAVTTPIYATLPLDTDRSVGGRLWEAYWLYTLNYMAEVNGSAYAVVPVNDGFVCSGCPTRDDFRLIVRREDDPSLEIVGHHDIDMVAVVPGCDASPIHAIAAKTSLGDRVAHISAAAAGYRLATIGDPLTQPVRPDVVRRTRIVGVVGDFREEHVKGTRKANGYHAAFTAGMYLSAPATQRLRRSGCAGLFEPASHFVEKICALAPRPLSEMDMIFGPPA